MVSIKNLNLKHFWYMMYMQFTDGFLYFSRICKVSGGLLHNIDYKAT